MKCRHFLVPLFFIFNKPEEENDDPAHDLVKLCDSFDQDGIVDAAAHAKKCTNSMSVVVLFDEGPLIRIPKIENMASFRYGSYICDKSTWTEIGNCGWMFSPTG